MSVGSRNLVKISYTTIGMKIFNAAVLTLNFDLDLSKVNSEMWQMLNICT